MKQNLDQTSEGFTPSDLRDWMTGCRLERVSGEGVQVYIIDSKFRLANILDYLSSHGRTGVVTASTHLVSTGSCEFSPLRRLPTEGLLEAL